jgi:hypothetical protein
MISAQRQGSVLFAATIGVNVDGGTPLKRAGSRRNSAIKQIWLEELPATRWRLKGNPQ